MGWPHKEISFEDLLNLVKGFVDILILASGYQSSGLPAHWDALNVNKAFQFGLFFENLFRHLSNSEDFKDSVQELDSALLEMTSSPRFPQGIIHLSSVTLTKAREIVLSHMLHTLPLREANLRAILTATVDMDLDDLEVTESAHLDVNLNKLKQYNISLNHRKSFNNSIASSSNENPNIQTGSRTSDTLTACAVQELVKRQFSVSRVLAAESGLEFLSKTIRHSNFSKSSNILSLEQLKLASDSFSKEQSVEHLKWNHWRSKSLSYMMHKRTLRLVSGASMLFSAPKAQWLHMFEQLNILAQTNVDLLESVEILLFGCISSRWSGVIDQYMSASYDSVTISKQYQEVHNLLLRRVESLHTKNEATDSKESGILEYLTEMLGDQINLLWKLSPVLAALAIPSWSPLFRTYLSEIEAQFKGDSSKIRQCTCIQDKEEHRECELAERISCLYTFHVLGVPCNARVK